jgi:hypothetical protein
VSGLSERDMRILAFERRGWPSAGVKEQAIAEVLDLPATRYYQLLNELIDRPEESRRFRARFGRDLWIAGRFEPGDGKLWEERNGERRAHAPRGYDHLRN